MHGPARFTEQRRDMAARTVGLTHKELSTAQRGLRVETVGGGFGRQKRKLVELKGSQLRRDQVRIISQIAEAVGSRERKLFGVVQARIEEGALTMHLEV